MWLIIVWGESEHLGGGGGSSQRMPHLQNAEPPPENIELQEQFYLTEPVQSNFENEQVNLKYWQSPVVVIETLPMVTEPIHWDYNIPLRIEKNNFTVIGVLGMLAHSVLAW